MFRLGQEYGKLYETLINNNENGSKNEVYSYSDERDICTSSSKAFSLGLYGPGTGPLMNAYNNNSETWLPPWESEPQYKFDNSSALPKQIDALHNFMNDDKARVFFESQLIEKCPSLFVLRDPLGVSSPVLAAIEAHLNLQYKEIFSKLKAKNIKPQGSSNLDN